MKSVQKALDDKDLEIKIAAEKANAAVAEVSCNEMRLRDKIQHAEITI